MSPYRQDERWPCGEFPNLSEQDTGLPAWTAQDRPIENTDVVLWHVFGIHHITRPEDWPVMPVDIVSFWLKPFGFFDRNPALDVPPAAQECESLRPSSRKNRFEGLVKTSLSRVLFRNMTSEELSGDPSRASPAGPSGERGDPETDGAPGPGGERLNLTDPKAIRALAHPLRWALLEALSDAGTLTATQASEILGESPANCAFHLRTLAKYGFVEEAGGGRGRERPWRLLYDSMSVRNLQEDPEATQAAQALTQVWLDRSLARARRSLTSRASWPKAFDDTLGEYMSRIYVTPAEAGEIYSEIEQVFERLVGPHSRYWERRNPQLRPADAVPVEFFLLGYPVSGPLPLPGDQDTQAR